MPHRVANFFRSSASSLEQQVSTLTKTSRKRESPHRTGRETASSERVFSYASSIEDDTENRQLQTRSQSQPLTSSRRGRMTDSNLNRSDSGASDKEHHPHHHRLSFPGMHFGRSGRETHANSLLAVDWKLESPPIVMYGDAENSTGALVSGQLYLDIKQAEVEVESFNATLSIRLTQKKAFVHHCNDCTNQTTELKKWCLLPQPLLLKKGTHSYPISVLLEGHLPATVDGALVGIAYEFKAEAVVKSNGVLLPAVKLERVLEVKRSLPVPELPHHSIRVFPPTNIKANVHYPHVIHPIGTYTLSIRLDGIAKHNTRVNTMEYWKLKKLTWRLEEISKTIAPACEKHCPKAIEGGPQPKKGISRTDTRVIGEKTIFSGWKSNYGGLTDSTVELELEYNLAKHAKYACDTKSRDGSEITHQLMVEMVVSQEWAPVNKPALVTHTGVGRILRMHFTTILTERGGIGISWDNEAPPIYQDVPPSPPAYCEEMVFGDSSIIDRIESLDALSGDSTSPNYTATGPSRSDGSSMSSGGR
ncbi:protein LDB19 [Rhypophila decipiens]|uniref:Protein LDB19 n=1 Tax=Rhypophila decipiens TaxID=261697 RepID=A0AAN7B6M8_9PEZI|nr:protein LDB19 [Rhypophila decipiens]